MREGERTPQGETIERAISRWGDPAPRAKLRPKFGDAGGNEAESVFERRACEGHVFQAREFDMLEFSRRGPGRSRLDLNAVS